MNINLIITTICLALTLNIKKTSSDLLDLQVKILKENYTGKAHKFYEQVTKRKYSADLKSLGKSAPRVNRLPMLPVYERSLKNKTSKDESGKSIPHVLTVIKKMGYDGEEHYVTTPDGYILRVHRIPGGPNNPRRDGKPVVFMHHGLLMSSELWLIMGPQVDLAYMLVDAGYDVWLGNGRGNTYSRNHVSLLPDFDPQFWHFSYHEIALYDAPASIDYMLEMTGQKDLIYIGHSMGTSISYILMSLRPEYNKKFRLVISLAPVAFWHDTPRPVIQLLKDRGEDMMGIFANANVYEIMPLSILNSGLSNTLCMGANVFHYYCLRLFSYFFGPNRLPPDTVSRVIKFFPAGASRQTITHFCQAIGSGEFQAFDHGPEMNMRKYGQEKAPYYPIENIEAPVALYYGMGDHLVAPADPVELATKLKSLVSIKLVGDDKFNHVDFLYMPNIKELMIDHIMDLIRNVTGDKI